MQLNEFTIPNQIKLGDGMAAQSRTFVVGANCTAIEHDGFTVTVELKGGRYDGKLLILTPMGYGFAERPVAMRAKPAKAAGAVQ